MNQYADDVVVLIVCLLHFFEHHINMFQLLHIAQKQTPRLGGNKAKTKESSSDEDSSDSDDEEEVPKQTKQISPQKKQSGDYIVLIMNLTGNRIFSKIVQ